MNAPPWKVGELARRTGLSVRTLHHYDAIGLLSPSHRTEAGHRLYAAADAARLQQILSLRQLGFSLEEVRDCLDRPEFSPRRVIRMHIDRLQERIESQRRLCEKLESIAGRLDSAEEISADEFLQTMEAMNMLEKFYTPEQLEQLRERRRVVGEERIHEVEAEWPRLMSEVRAEMDSGTDPASETVQALARRWMGLVREFTGGDSALEQSLCSMYEQEPSAAGVDTAGLREMMPYIRKAIAASKQAQ